MLPNLNQIESITRSQEGWAHDPCAGCVDTSHLPVCSICPHIFGQCHEYFKTFAWAHIPYSTFQKSLSTYTFWKPYGSSIMSSSWERERETLLSRILWWVQSMHPHVYAWSWAPGHSTHAYMAHTVITINNTNQKSTVRPEDTLLLLTCSRLHLHYPLYTQLQLCPGHLFSFISCTEEDGEENWTETKKNHYSHTGPWFWVHSKEKKAAEMLLLIDGTCDLAQIRDPVALHTTAAEQQHSLVVRTLYL